MDEDKRKKAMREVALLLCHPYVSEADAEAAEKICREHSIPFDREMFDEMVKVADISRDDWLSSNCW